MSLWWLVLVAVIVLALAWIAARDLDARGAPPRAQVATALLIIVVAPLGLVFWRRSALHHRRAAS